MEAAAKTGLLQDFKKACFLKIENKIGFTGWSEF